MLVFHRTDNPSAILSGGFRDGEPGKEAGEAAPGVWVSADRPLNTAEWPHGGAVIEIDIRETLFAEHEWLNPGMRYREALIPAADLNLHRATARELAAG